jgi:hypothetical protein
LASAETESGADPIGEGGSGDSQAYVDQRLWAARRLEAKATATPNGSKPVKASSATTEPDEDTASALRAVELRLRNAQVANEEQDLALRRLVARWSIGFVCAQLLAANVFFGWYLWFNRVNPDGKIMVVWLTSSVIEVIGIVAVIATSLFPSKKNRRKLKPGKLGNGKSAG